MKLYVNETDFLDFNNAYDEFTEFGEKWVLIEPLKEELLEENCYLKQWINYSSEFSIEMLEDINYPIYKLTRE